MLEDETFLRLKRLPLSEVKHLWMKSPKAGVFELYQHVTKHHWPLEAYIQFHYKDFVNKEIHIEIEMLRHRRDLRDLYNIKI